MIFNDFELYPTPEAIAELMVDKLTQKNYTRILEPSAGTGNLIKAISNKYPYCKIDAIEIDVDLCEKLKRNHTNIHVFCDDWLSYNDLSYYDAIIMNPPFSNGVKHLLKAWNFLNSGEIVCLLNEETIKNPFSKERKILINLIEQHGCVDFLGDVFSDSERKTNVNVALVYLKKEAMDSDIDLSDLLNDVSSIKDDVNTNIDSENNLIGFDEILNFVQYYNCINEHMKKAINHFEKAIEYLSYNNINLYESDISRFFTDLSNTNEKMKTFSDIHKNRAWHSLINRLDFIKYLDGKQREKFIKEINELDVSITCDNIKSIMNNIFIERNKFFKDSCKNIFEQLTRYYKGNVVHVEGWKSNSNYKINQKIVFPYGCDYDPKWGFSRRWSYGGFDFYLDIDRALCVIAGEKFENISKIVDVLEYQFDVYNQILRRPHEKDELKKAMTTESTFFDIKFFKKGTVHLVFKDKKLLDELNKIACDGIVSLFDDKNQN